MKSNESHAVSSFPILFDVLDAHELEFFGRNFGCTAAALRAVTFAAIWNRHLDATIVSQAEGKRPVILRLNIGLSLDAAVYYSIEPDGALVRGYCWTIDHEPLDDRDGGFFYCDYRLPVFRDDERGRRHEPVVPGRVAAALGNVLDHFLPDEFRDFESVDEPARERHIFKDLGLLDEWLRHIATLLPADEY